MFKYLEKFKGGGQANFLGNINFEIGVVQCPTCNAHTWANILGGFPFRDLGAQWAQVGAAPMPRLYT